jgi:hypothetical protein
MNPLVEYVQMSIARGELDNRMRELQQQILAGFANGEIRRYVIDDVLVEVDTGASTIRLLPVKRLS